MDVPAFLTESRVLIVAGKGGVGKTTVSAALGRLAAEEGLSALLVELEGRPGLQAAFGDPTAFEYEESVLYEDPSGGEVRGRLLTPDDALVEYLADHGLQRVSKRLVSSGVVDVVATAIPGIRDVLVLGKVKQLERSGVADLIVVDAPATGHAMTFLTSARGLLHAARGGPVRAQAADVDALLTDPRRCRVLLVCLAEEMPVAETIEAGFQLEDRAGVHLGGVVVNALDRPPPELAHALDATADEGLRPATLGALEAARRFRWGRHELEAAQLARLARELPLPQVHLPEVRAPTLGPNELARLAEALRQGVKGLDEADP